MSAKQIARRRPPRAARCVQGRARVRGTRVLKGTGRGDAAPCLHAGAGQGLGGPIAG